jgi:hypothetical protein
LSHSMNGRSYHSCNRHPFPGTYMIMYFGTPKVVHPEDAQKG